MRSDFCTALAFSIPFVLVSEPLAGKGEGEVAVAVPEGCDTTQNRKVWYLKHRECGSESSQASLLANVSMPRVEGGQFSFLMNVAAEEVKGTQVAGGVNYASHAHNQIAYSLNLAGKVDGFQWSHINIADSVKGSQFGIVNVAKNLDGLSLAFLTLAGNGLFHLDASAEETGMSTLGFASGKGFFTSYSLGYTLAEASHPFALGMGLGYHHAFGGSYLEGEIHGRLVADRQSEFEEIGGGEDRPHAGDWRHNTLVQAKIRAGATLIGNMGVFGGVSYNALETHGNARLMGPWTDAATHVSDDLSAWPGVEIGIRVGR